MARRSGITFKRSGDFGDAVKFLEKERKSKKRFVSILRRFGEKGVELLKEATPKRTGKTSRSWSYKVRLKNGSYALEFQNDNLFRGVPIVVLLVYGHATQSGRWIEGRDFITPVTDPLFKDLQNQIRKEVMSWQEKKSNS